MPRPISGFVHAVPWLMLATTMRIIYAVHDGLAGQTAFFVANVAIFLAFLIVSHQMIVLTGGRTELGSLGLGKQVEIGRGIILRITLSLAVLSFAVAWLGAPGVAAYLVAAFDGIAFDQYSRAGILLSSVLAAIVLLMVLASERGDRATILGAVGELAGRRNSLLPAIAAVAVFLLVLSEAQGIVRGGVQQIWQTAWLPYPLRAFVYFAFIFSFATLRLCGVLAILIVGLRRSYRRGEGSSAAPAAAPSE